MTRRLFMGSSLAPILVKRVLDDVIDNDMESIDFHLLFWYSYVDDHITAVPEEKISTVLDALHAYDPHIRFTYETEQLAKLDYLDITIHRI